MMKPDDFPALITRRELAFSVGYLEQLICTAADMIERDLAATRSPTAQRMLRQHLTRLRGAADGLGKAIEKHRSRDTATENDCYD